MNIQANIGCCLVQQPEQYSAVLPDCTELINSVGVPFQIMYGASSFGCGQYTVGGSAPDHYGTVAVIPCNKIKTRHSSEMTITQITEKWSPCLAAHTHNTINLHLKVMLIQKVVVGLSHVIKIQILTSVLIFNVNIKWTQPTLKLKVSIEQFKEISIKM